MSMQGYNKDIPLGAEETRTFDFPVPTNTEEYVLGIDTETGHSFFNLATINSIIRAIEDQNQSGDRKYIYQLRRDGYKIRDMVSDLVKPELVGPVYAGFYINLSPAQYQLYMRQVVTGTGLQKRTLSVIFQKSLV